jgi:hypothetical protein
MERPSYHMALPLLFVTWRCEYKPKNGVAYRPNDPSRFMRNF